MNGQQESLLPSETVVPHALVEFLAGIAARYAYGDAPTTRQRAAASHAADQMADVLVRLKEGGYGG